MSRGDEELRALERAFLATRDGALFERLDVALKRAGLPRYCSSCSFSTTSNVGNVKDPDTGEVWCVPCLESALEHGHANVDHDPSDPWLAEHCPTCRALNAVTDTCPLCNVLEADTEIEYPDEDGETGTEWVCGVCAEERKPRFMDMTAEELRAEYWAARESVASCSGLDRLDLIVNVARKRGITL